MLTRPLPGVANAEQLVTAENPASYPYIERYREQKNLFAGVAAVQNCVQFNVAFEGRNGKPERVFGQLVSPDYFSVLGMDAQRGRLLSADLDKTGAPASVVISDRYWRSRLNADPDVIGQNDPSQRTVRDHRRHHPAQIRWRSHSVSGRAFRPYDGVGQAGARTRQRRPARPQRKGFPIAVPPRSGHRHRFCRGSAGWHHPPFRQRRSLRAAPAGHSEAGSFDSRGNPRADPTRRPPENNGILPYAHGNHRCHRVPQSRHHGPGACRWPPQGTGHSPRCRSQPLPPHPPD